MDSYQKSGVNLKLARGVKANLPRLLRRATRPEVLGKVGAFGGLFRAGFPGYRDPVLVASMDGVGTKLRVAVAMKKHDTVGRDLVNHCCNDIAVMGADPLFFLDYMGTGKLEEKIFDQVIQGLAQGCVEAGVALLGGETAQMPGFYQKGDYDLVGTIIGLVERKKILDGSLIRSGDTIIGFASTGLHTNGYTLARQVLFEKKKMKPGFRPSELKGISVGEALLQVHRNYHPLLKILREKGWIHGAAHITGGGFEENIARVLPANGLAKIWRGSWEVPPIFRFIQQHGKISDSEMHSVFNMGIGMAVMAPMAHLSDVLAEARKTGIRAFEIGKVARGKRGVRLG